METRSGKVKTTIDVGLGNRRETEERHEVRRTTKSKKTTKSAAALPRSQWTCSPLSDAEDPRPVQSDQHEHASSTRAGEAQSVARDRASILDYLKNADNFASKQEKVRFLATVRQTVDDLLANDDAATTCLGGAHPSAALDTFVKNLRVAEMNDDVLSFPPDTRLGGDVDLRCLAGKLLVRQCYTELRDILLKLARSTKRLVVDGTPGIGKSFFTYYLIHVLMGMKKTVVWEPAGSDELVVCITPTATQFAVSAHSFEGQLSDRSTWYIVDGHAPENVSAITLLVTSVDRLISKPFERLGAEKRYMPVWSREEVKKAHAAGVARAQDGQQELEWNEVNEIYRKWGGVARYVFQWAHNAEEQASLDKDIEVDLFKLYNCERGVNYDGIVNNRLLHVGVDTDLPATDGKKYATMKFDFASDYVTDQVCQRLVRHDERGLMRFLNGAI